MVAVLRAEQFEQFEATGWIVVPGLVGSDVLNAVDREVDRLVSDAPPPEDRVGPHFYWRSSSESPALFVPIHGDRGIQSVAEELVAEGGIEVAFDQAQVALNIPPYGYRPGRPHIDGYAPDHETPGTFTLLAGLLLTDQLLENCGNLWVWPGTHVTHAAFCAAHGAAAFAEAGGYPDVELPEPTQVLGRRGDVLLAHYLLGHNIGGNHASDVTRRAVYWRLRALGHAGRWQACLVDAWAEYRGLRDRRRTDPAGVQGDHVTGPVGRAR